MKPQPTLKEGTLVRHIVQSIEGRILGMTRIRLLFENSSDDFEYRVQTKEGIRICSPTNLEIVEVDNAEVIFKTGSRVETGRHGVQLVCEELARRGYHCSQMPDNNRGFDLKCVSPKGNDFRIEVKYSKAGHEFVHLQIRTHLECALQRDLFYAFIRPMSDTNPWPEFSVMTHVEVQAAWAQMPRTKPDGTPYVIDGTGYIHWRHLAPHFHRWEKLPE